MHLLILALLVASIKICDAQSVGTRIGARHSGMGYASFTVADDAALFNNIGGMARIENPVALFCYELAPELQGGNRTAAAISIPSAIGVFALGAFRFGDALYSEQLLTVGFGHRLGSTSLGAKLNHVQYSADGFQTQTTMTFDVGGLTQITPQLFVGGGIFNVTQACIAEHEPLPVILVAAIGYQPDERIHLVAEAEKKLGYPLRTRYGLEYEIARKIFVRTGVNLNPTALFIGLGARTRRLNYDYSISFVSALGFIYQASATCRLGDLQKP